MRNAFGIMLAGWALLTGCDDTPVETDAMTGSDAGPGFDGGAETICRRWRAARADLSEGTWSGSVTSCDPGDMDAAWRARTLQQVNAFRFIAGMPDVATAAGADSNAQACALMMDANGMLSHSPPTSWTCYSAAGSDGSGASNLAPTPALEAVLLYMVDRGNATTLGHRRWILSNSLGPIGLGSTSGPSASSCMQVIGGTGRAGRPFVAWPPAGAFPVEAGIGAFNTIDETGWSIHSDLITFSGASVTVTEEGSDRPVVTTQLLPNFGSGDAISFIPQGWTMSAGTTYHVSVTGASSAIEYDVSTITCP